MFQGSVGVFLDKPNFLERALMWGGTSLDKNSPPFWGIPNPAAVWSKFAQVDPRLTL